MQGRGRRNPQLSAHRPPDCEQPETTRNALLPTAHPRAPLPSPPEQDPSCISYSQALMYLKGYHAVQVSRATLLAPSVAPQL